MKTIIAEKPSVAREIARIVDARKKEDGYYTGNGYAVTWAFGHLVQLALPEEYGIKGFSRASLPIIPRQFKLVARQGRTDKGYKPDAGTVRQIGIIKRLFDQSERIIVATDAGREGELIFRYLYSYTDCHKPFDRLWISSLTDKAIRAGLAHLEDGAGYDNLYLAAKTRSEADWLVGINGTQALSIAAGTGTYSVGRVQTPTLAMVCSRYWENRRFVPEAFWQLHIAADSTLGTPVKFSSEEKWMDKDTAERLYGEIKDVHSARITRVQKKEKREDSPLLYDLTTLQREANSKHGLTADETLSIAQKLYEAKLITYPRTGSRYIPEDVFAEIPQLLDKLKKDDVFGRSVCGLTELSRACVDNSKVSDHHALLITGQPPIGIFKKDLTVYRMIAGRMAEAFSECCIKDTTVIEAECGNVRFTARGSVVRQAGWRGVCQEKQEDTILPDWKEGETVTLSACSITEGKTKPKSLHTEASLLAAMETAGKEIEDEKLRQALKDCGIGTPATRASIIETLLGRELMCRVKASLVPTEKGLALYSVVKDMDIANVELTGRWEAELARIEKGDLSDDAFMLEIREYTKKVTADLLASDKLFRGKESGCRCPKCKTGKMRFYGKVVKCDNAECGLPLFRQIAGRTLSEGEAVQLLETGKTGLLKGFRNKQGKSFDACLMLDGDFNVKFVFPDTKNRGRRPRKEK